MKQVQLNMSLETAAAVAKALDFFTRIGIGQFGEITQFVRNGEIPRFSVDGPRKTAEIEDIQTVDALVNQIKRALGYPTNGSYGIGHKNNSKVFLRSFEANKVLEQALAMDRDPNPNFRGVNYDGLTFRYTSETAPSAQVVEVSE